MSLPTPENLKRAVEIVGKIESLKAELTALLYGGKAVKTPGKRGRPAKADKAAKAPKAAKPKRQLSEEARARIIAAQKKRWAKVKKAKKETTAEG
jgi:hypothetical protein